MKVFGEWGRSLRILGILFIFMFFFIFGWVSIPILFFPSAHEILYQGEILTTTCSPVPDEDRRENSNCITLYELKIGNTGTKDQKMVRIKFPKLPSLRESAYKILDIFASTKKQPESEINRSESPAETIYEVTPFPENKVLTLSFYTVGYRDYLELKKVHVHIKAKGKVVECDPEITVLARIFKNFFGLFF
jgi:hypothetical protein